MTIDNKDFVNLESKIWVKKKLGSPQEDRPELLSIIDVTEFPIVLYGAGSGFHSFSAFVLSKFNLNVLTVVDKKFQVSQDFYGYKATSPEKYFNDIRSSVPIVVIVTIGDPREYQAIRRQLENYRFLKLYWAYDFFEYFFHYTPIEKIQNSRKILEDNESDIETAFDLLADKKSRDTFYSILNFYYSKCRPNTPSDCLSDQYFPRDVPVKKDYSCFVDGGAYRGDTLSMLVARGIYPEEYYAFEPDVEHFRFLRSHEGLKLLQTVVLAPVALSDKKQSLYFSSNNTNSTLSSRGEDTVLARPLDDLLRNANPTYIKLDIEGAEFEALAGAKKVINRCQPELAIAIYHHLEHLWEIPILINGMQSGYKYYLRNYTGGVSETILYALS